MRSRQYDAWEKAVEKVKKLAREWRGKPLPDSGVDNPVMQAISDIVTVYLGSLSRAERLRESGIACHDHLASIFFEELRA